MTDPIKNKAVRPPATPDAQPAAMPPESSATKARPTKGSAPTAPGAAAPTDLVEKGGPTGPVLNPRDEGGVHLPAPRNATTETPPRKPEELFDYAEGLVRTPSLPRPGYLEGVFRGTVYRPVFGEGGNWFTRGAADAGNWIMGEIGKAAGGLVHEEHGITKAIPITDQLILGFKASGRKVREDDLPMDDGRRMGIAELRRNHPNALPMWIEGSFGQNLGFAWGHSVPIGPTGATVNFGFTATEGMALTMQRLMFVPGTGSKVEGEQGQLSRLKLQPLSAEDVSKMETGATFKVTGQANLRLDAALGIGATIPALGDAVRVGASVEVGAYATLTGEMSMEVQRREEGKARMTLTSLGSASAGAQLKALVGVEVNYQEVARIMRGFVDYVARGGDAKAFRDQLPNERERALASDMSGYMRLLAKNLAEGTGREVIDYLVQQYAVAYLQARGGIDLASNFKIEVDFDLNAQGFVVLPRADMVPAAMRNGVAADQQLKIKAADLARLAYEMAVRGDLRLLQQLSLIRGSGVRINERVTTEKTGTSSELNLKLPFIEYRTASATTRTVIDRFTPELGRTRSAIAAFDKEYRGIFGDAEKSSAEVRVHTPEGSENSTVFFGSDENVSADLVVQNKVEKWTDYEEMQDLVGILSALSNGRLEARAREALAGGKYRGDNLLDDVNLIHQLFFKPREYGRTVAHLHVWLGEAGLRELLEKDLSDDQLYANIARAFNKLEPNGGDKLPDWAKAGADRRIPKPADDEPAGPYDHDLQAAVYLVDNLKRLRAGMRAAETPAAEEKVASEIRDFLRDCKDKLGAYTALALMVPERDRAVELRLASIADGRPPIRFTYIQDGRTSELLRATGFARMAMQQYQRYAAVLDSETRARVGNIIRETHEVLNSASPDPYRLKVAMTALEAELKFFDERAAAMTGRVEQDLGVGRTFLDALPAATTIQAVLPNDAGRELATMRLAAMRDLNAPEPNLPILRSTFKNLLARMPEYRRIQAAAPLVEGVAKLANELAKTQPALVKEAQDAVAAVRAAISERKDDVALDKAMTALTRAHATLLDAAGSAAAIDSALVTVEKAPEPPVPTSRGQTAAELAAARKATGDRYVTLAGNPQVAPVSYFERAGVVPPSYMGVPYESGGEGIVTGAMLRAADLAMVQSRVSDDLGLPKLSPDHVKALVDAAKQKDATRFLELATKDSFQPAVVIPEPSRQLVEYLLLDVPDAGRKAFLQRFSEPKRRAIERIWSEQETLAAREARDSDRGRKARTDFLRENPRYDEDLKFLKELYAREPQKLEMSLDDLGYGRMIDDWRTTSTARLEAAMSQLTGDELNRLVSNMDRKQRDRFAGLLRASDLSPQTRAKLAGQVVDDNFFWRNDAELVEALVTGMNAGDLRVFFDQLYTDGKLEDFLSPGSLWETLLAIFTFGLARLFIHDNDAALRVVAAQGWSADELFVEYGAKPKFVSAVQNRAERVFFNATADTIPMDPTVRGGLKVLHQVLGNVKYYHFAELPAEAARMLEEMAKGAGKQLVARLGDVAKGGGGPKEIIEEYQKFFAGLSPKAISRQLETGDTDGSAAIVAKAITDGALAGLIIAAYDPRNHFLTPDLIMGLARATNKLDSPMKMGPFADNRVDKESWRQLMEKCAFFQSYTGLDFRNVELLYGGVASLGGAPAVTFGPTISIAPAYAPMKDNKIQIGDDFQQTIAFHEAVHVVQQMTYGSRVNSFVDQGIHIGSSGDRNQAYRVTQEMFDKATSIHDFQHHWEQQAELIEYSLRLLWARSQEGGGESYPGPGRVLRVAGGNIELTPERWAKMVKLVHEFGDSGKRAFGASAGKFQFIGTRDPV